ncbi:hypothetical protein T01_2672 [Trichinella spiralis]|uniref:Uncharacterized protein n=1 Tax=Trichinella spiralis TaxID=6334 RepID=A0A0V1AX96_TRISP|nr:hypothetical protein T01_2672 [Trichinella spiralis]
MFKVETLNTVAQHTLSPPLHLCCIVHCLRGFFLPPLPTLEALFESSIHFKTISNGYLLLLRSTVRKPAKEIYKTFASVAAVESKKHRSKFVMLNALSLLNGQNSRRRQWVACLFELLKICSR